MKMRLVLTRVCAGMLFLFLVAASPFAPLASANPAPQALAPLSLPAGFADETSVGGLLAPRAFEFTPDGRILILERGSDTTNDINYASVRVFKNGALLPARALTLSVCGDGERGLLGIALDPAFAANGYLYLYYTRQAPSGSVCAYNTYAANQPGPRNRISRFTLSGDLIDPLSERVLVDNIASDSGIHNAGDLHFGADGYLYASVGDSNLQPSPAQNLSSLNGKILRILPTAGDAGGYTTPANPYDSAAGAWYCGINPPGSGSGPCREVFASGLRNPFRFSIPSGTSSLYIADVGGGAWEEMDAGSPGANYGYPLREGPCPAGQLCLYPPQIPSGYTDPLYAYPHTVLNANFDSAIIGGPLYTGASYPAPYQNGLFFADYVQGWIHYLTYDVPSATWQKSDFASGGNGLIGIRTGLDSDLYYLSFVSDTLRTSEIHHIRYTPGVNQPPVAQLSVTPSGGPPDQVFQFSTAGTVDPDGNLPLTYNWDFGDGTTLSSTTAASPTKVYASPGQKTVTLTVTDSGLPPATSAPVSVSVFPGDPPPSASFAVANLSEPGRALYHAGDTWSYQLVSASDNAPLPPDAFSWDVVFHHRSHTHPFLSNLPGSSGQFTIPSSGETDPAVWYQVVLHVKDSVGQVTTVTQDILPQTVNLTVDTLPGGAEVLVEGKALSAPATLTRVVGIQSSLDVPSPQWIAGRAFTFERWSNAGPQAQTFTVPALDTRYTASLLTRLFFGLIFH